MQRERVSGRRSGDPCSSQHHFSSLWARSELHVLHMVLGTYGYPKTKDCKQNRAIHFPKLQLADLLLCVDDLWPDQSCGCLLGCVHCFANLKHLPTRRPFPANRKKMIGGFGYVERIYDRWSMFSAYVA